MNNFNKYNLKRYILYFIIFILISVLTFYLLYRFFFGQGEELHILINFSFNTALALALLLFIYFTLDGIRLYYILKSLDYKLSFRNIYKLVFIKIFVSNITPFTTGGGLAEIYYLQSQGVATGKSSAAVVLRTVITSTLLLIAGPVIITANPEFLGIVSGRLFIIGIIIFLLSYFGILYIMVFRTKLLKKFSIKVVRFFKDKNILSHKNGQKILKYVFEHVALFSNDIILFFNAKKIYLFITVIISVVFLVTEYSFSYILFRELGYTEVTLINVILLHTVIAFIMYFAPTPGATGVAEGGFIFFFRNIAKRDDIFSLLFFWRFFTIYIGIFVGMLVFSYLIMKNNKMKKNNNLK